MIQSFRSKGLRELFEEGDSKQINPQWKTKLRIRLTALDEASEVEEMNVDGWKLHELSGDRKGTWAVKVTANQRMTFEFEDGHAYVVDLEDYH